MRLLLAFCLSLLLVPASLAGTYVIQGDTVYWGDSVDLTGVYGWECTVAWWKGGISDSVWPDRTEEVCYQSHNILITPERFPEGSWYKWDGKIGNHENDEAFRVKAYRPTTVPTPTPNITYTQQPMVPTTQPILNTPVPKATPRITTVVTTAQPAPVATPAGTETPVDGIAPPSKAPPLPIFFLGLVIILIVAYWWVRGTF